MSEANIEKEFLDLYELYADAIFRHSLFRLRDRERARDITQEAFLRAWRTLRQGTKLLQARAWLYRVATNLIIDSTRRTPALSLDQLVADGFEPAQDHADRQIDFLDGAAALAKLEKLEPKYRDAVYYRYVDQLSPGEIAKVMGAQEGTVSVWIHRGIEKLRALLNHE